MSDVKTPQEIWGKGLVMHGQAQSWKAAISPYGTVQKKCAHARLLETSDDAIECSDCGLSIQRQALRRLNLRVAPPSYDTGRMKLADECGRLRSENDALLRENRTLRLRAEAAERRRR